jgi:hypothetical protein
MGITTISNPFSKVFVKCFGKEFAIDNPVNNINPKIDFVIVLLKFICAP